MVLSRFETVCTKNQRVDLQESNATHDAVSDTLKICTDAVVSACLLGSEHVTPV